MGDPLPFELPLTTRRVGHHLVFMREVDSTNRVLSEMANEGAPEGTVVLTDYQQAGRGRRQRGWVTPPGTSLLMSVLLRPPRLTERHALLPLVVGVVVARTLETHLGLQPSLKWPNDVLLAGRKCCGILIESSTDGAGKTAVIVGTGLNVNQSAADFAGLPDATSLRLALGQPVERGGLLAAFLKELEVAYDAFQAGWTPHDDWRKRATLLGKSVLVRPADGDPYPAVARDIAPDGSLLVETTNGQVQPLQAAEVSIRL